MLVFIAFCVLMLVVAVIVWRPQDAGIYPLKHWKPKYRSLGAPPPVPSYIRYDEDHWPNEKGSHSNSYRGVGDGAEAEQGMKSSGSLLEEFNVRVFFDKLEDQNLHLASQLARHNNDLQQFYSKISSQVNDLKGMINNLDVEKLEEIERLRRESPLNNDGSQVENNLIVSNTAEIRRNIKFTGNGLNVELMQKLQMLLDKLNSGQLHIPSDLLRGAGSGLQRSQRTVIQPGSVKVDGQSDLLRRQNAERIQLERELAEIGNKQLNDFTGEEEELTLKLLTKAAEELADKLQGDPSEAQVHQIMELHQKQVADALDKFHKSRQEQQETLKQSLAYRRRQRENALRGKHENEAKQANLPPPIVPTDTASDKIQLDQYVLQQISLDSMAEEAKSKTQVNHQTAEDCRSQMSELLTSQIDTLQQNQEMSQAEAESLLQAQRQAEKQLRDRIEAKRSQQLVALQQRLNQKRNMRLEALKEKQEHERNELSSHLLTEGKHKEHDRLMRAKEEESIIELAAAEAELDAEQAEHENAITKAGDEEHINNLKDVHKDIIERLTTSSVDPVLAQKLMDNYRRETEAFTNNLSHQRERQSAELQAVLAKRRAKRLEQAQQRNEKSAAKRFLEEQEWQMSGAVVDTVTDDTFIAPEFSYQESAEERALKKEQERLAEEIKGRHKKERSGLASELDKERNEEEQRQLSEFEKEKQKVLQEKKNRQATEITAGKDLSQAEMSALMASHENEIKILTARKDSEYQRQQLQLREKLETKRRRKTEALRKKQEVELTKEMLTQAKEIEEIRSKKAMEVEKKAIAEGIKENGFEDSDKVVRAIMSQRHSQEMKDLEQEYAARRRVIVDDALVGLAAKYDKLKDEMSGEHQKQLQQLQKQGLSPEDYKERQVQLLNEQSLARAELDKEYSREQKEIQSDLTEWELQHARAKLQLKEKHYKEFSDTLRQFAPGHQSMEQAVAAAEELESVRQKLEEQRKEQQDARQKEIKEFEKKEKENQAEELRLYQNSLDKEMENEKQKHKRNMEQLQKRKEEMIKEKKQKQQVEIERMQQAGASKSDMKQVFEAHEKDLQTLISKMEADKLRVQTSLKERLQKKQQERLNAKQNQVAKTSEEKRKELLQNQQKDNQKLNMDEILTLKESANIDYMVTRGRPVEHATMEQSAAHVPNLVPEQLTVTSATTDDRQIFSSSSPLDDAELTALLMASPLYKKLEKVKSTVMNGGLDLGSRASNGQGYIDPLDAKWTTDEQLEPLDLNKLSVRSFVVYKFGCFVVDLLVAHCQHQHITLLLAEKIPPNETLKHNAYCNSFHYDANNNLLYIRLSRTESIGQFVLILVHIMAHLKARDLRDDSNPEFVKEFYKALSVVCDDMFFARYRTSSPAVKTSKNPDKTMDESASALLQALYGDASTEPEKHDMVAELLDTRILPATDGQGIQFNSERIQSRISKYAKYTLSHQLRGHLGDVEQHISAAKATGSEDSTKFSLMEMLPHTTAGNTLLTRKVLPQSVTIANMSGHAMWQTFINKNDGISNQSDHRNLKQNSEQLNKDVIYELEEQLDQLHADYSQQSSRAMELSSQIQHKEQEIARGMELINQGDKSALQNVKHRQEKLAILRSELAKEEMIKIATSEKLQECQRSFYQKKYQK